MKEEDKKTFSTIDGETLMNTPLDNRIIFLLSEFTKERTAFIGTPTEPASAIDPLGNEGILPKTVSRQIPKNVDALNKIGISAAIRRSNGRRLIDLPRADTADVQGPLAVDPDDPAEGYGAGVPLLQERASIAFVWTSGPARRPPNAVLRAQPAPSGTEVPE